MTDQPYSLLIGLREAVLSELEPWRDVATHMMRIRAGTEAVRLIEVATCGGDHYLGIQVVADATLGPWEVSVGPHRHIC